MLLHVSELAGGASCWTPIAESYIMRSPRTRLTLFNRYNSPTLDSSRYLCIKVRTPFNSLAQGIGVCMVALSPGRITEHHQINMSSFHCTQLLHPVVSLGAPLTVGKGHKLAPLRLH
jgi:hypothetical protein